MPLPFSSVVKPGQHSGPAVYIHCQNSFWERDKEHHCPHHCLSLASLHHHCALCTLVIVGHMLLGWPLFPWPLWGPLIGSGLLVGLLVVHPLLHPWICPHTVVLPGVGGLLFITGLGLVISLFTRALWALVISWVRPFHGFLTWRGRGEERAGGSFTGPGGCCSSGHSPILLNL